ncbi:Hsp20/alpha crystallin family protein [Natronococcus wangiae]|uniref:Hsp20/alpha crystallin family protein n=1 Tax=Natronococcus wangiae TaxID=3068275 RepID=UPI003133C825
MGVDLVDHGDEFVLSADVLGFDTDEINVRISDITLSITAEHEEETEEQEELDLRSARAHKAISRSIRLPEPVEEESVTAYSLSRYRRCNRRKSADTRLRSIDRPVWNATAGEDRSVEKAVWISTLLGCRYEGTYGPLLDLSRYLIEFPFTYPVNALWLRRLSRPAISPSTAVSACYRGAFTISYLL